MTFRFVRFEKILNMITARIEAYVLAQYHLSELDKILFLFFTIPLQPFNLKPPDPPQKRAAQTRSHVPVKSSKKQANSPTRTV
jgi:hypothetical protein